MSKDDIRVLLIDGYIDDPAALGVPPYISPIVRAIAGAVMDAGASVEYLSIESLAGFDFFANVPTSIQNTAEATATPIGSF